MRFFNRLTCLIVIGVCLTTALPILAAITLARQQSIESEQRVALDLAENALHRAEETGVQLAAAARTINRLTPAKACSPEGLDVMRKIDLESTLLQGVGWMEGNVMRCSSFFGDGRPFDLGPPEFVSDIGAIHRTKAVLIDPDRPYLAVQSGNSVGIVHRDLALSFVDDIPGLSVSVFSVSHRKPLLIRGTVPPTLYTRDFGGESAFREGDMQIAMARSERYDIASIAILPLGHTANYAAQAAMILVPLGVVVGLILSYILIHVLKTRASMPMMMRTALKRQKFHLLYQPVVDLSTDRIIGAEALIRWDRGRNPEISPDRFIPVAEESGLIPLLTARVLELLSKDTREVLRIAPGFHFAVNFSPADMCRTDILEEVTHFIGKSGIAFENLIVEATERSLVDVERARETMQKLRGAGIRVAIDDFGTGYSSLAYLAQLEVDFLKIDRLFVQALGTGSATSHVAKRIIEIARDLDLKIVAEGIETPRQHMLFKRAKVEYAQGYLYGKPMPLDDLLQLIRSDRQPHPVVQRRRKAA